MPAFLRWPLKILFVLLTLGSIAYSVSLIPPMARVVKKHGLSNPIVLKGVAAVSILAAGSTLAVISLYAIMKAEVDEHRRKLRLPPEA
jgi:hypothetical protein